MKKFWHWLGYTLDYIAVVFIAASLNKFFWVSEVLDPEGAGAGLMTLLIVILLCLLALFTMVFWNANRILVKNMKINKFSLKDHFLCSGLFYAILLFMLVYLFFDSDLLTSFAVPGLVSVLAITVNIFYLQQVEKDKKFWHLFR